MRRETELVAQTYDEVRKLAAYKTLFSVPYVDHWKSCEVKVLNLDGSTAFRLRFYGIEATDLMLVPEGGETVREAIRRRGLDPDLFVGSPWHVTE